MEELKIKISEKLKLIEELIKNNGEKEKIEEERKALDEMLLKYTSKL